MVATSAAPTASMTGLMTAAPTASGVSTFGSILESPETFDLITE